METLDKLESSVHKLLEVNRKLREERDELSGRVHAASTELGDARETIRRLRDDIACFESEDGRFREFDVKKDALRQHILMMMEKIKQYSDSNDIDYFTNV